MHISTVLSEVAEHVLCDVSDTMMHEKVQHIKMNVHSWSLMQCHCQVVAVLGASLTDVCRHSGRKSCINPQALSMGSVCDSSFHVDQERFSFH